MINEYAKAVDITYEEMSYNRTTIAYENRNETLLLPDDLKECSTAFLMDHFLNNPRLAKIYRENHEDGVALCGDETIYLAIPVVSNPKVFGVILTDEDGNNPWHFGMDTLISLLMLFATYEVITFTNMNGGNHCPTKYEPLFQFLESKPESYKYLRDVYVKYQNKFREHKEFQALIEKYFGSLPEFDIYE